MDKKELILRCFAVLGTVIMTVAVAITTKELLSILSVGFGGLYLSLRDYY